MRSRLGQRKWHYGALPWGPSVVCAIATSCCPPRSPSPLLARAQVEEASAAAAHKKANEQSNDPMEKFCEGNEDADECRVYGECEVAHACLLACGGGFVWGVQDGNGLHEEKTHTLFTRRVSVSAE